MSERRFPRRMFGSVIVALFCAAAGVAADESLILPFAANGISRGETFVVLQGDDVWMDIAALSGAGVDVGSAGERIAREGRQLVSLRSLAPLVSYEVDLVALELRIQADPSMLGLMKFTKESNRPAGLEVLASQGGFLNYRATLQSFDDVTGFVDGGWSLRGHLLYSSALLDLDGDFRRGTTNLIVDQPGRMRRITFGDAFARTDQLGGNAQVGGVTVSREFLLDPYFVRYPSLDFAGSIATPSTVEVYINGALVDRRELPPGRFEIDNVAVPSGRGSATVLIRDAFGGERIIAEPYYASSLVLEEGLSEYSYSLGALRKNESTESFDYGNPALIASHRWGITDRITAGYRAEGTEDLWSAGASVAARFLIGEVAVLAGASEADGVHGTALTARYAYVTRSYSAAVSWMRMSDTYATISLAPELDRSTERVDFLGSLRLGRLDLSLHGSLETRRDFEGIDRIALLATWPIAARATVFTSAGMIATEGERSPELSVGLTWNLGFLRSAALRFDDRNDRSALHVSVQQNLAREPGWGYRLDGSLTEDDDSSSVLLQRQTDDVLLEVSANPSVGSDAVNVSAAGGLAWGGGRVHLMRAGQQSYAVVRIPGVAGVRVYVSNLEAGRTDANGEIVVTDLVPYYGNRIRIEDADIPMNYRVDDTERIIAPPLRGGVVVEFDVAPATSVGGIVVIQQPDGSIRIPATGELRLRSTSGEMATSPLGRGAEFYFEDIAPGPWDAEVVDEKGICRMTLHISPSDQPMQDVGTVTCKEVAP